MLTDWADRSQIPKEATMPVHYGAARYEHSLRTKRILRLAMDKLLDDEAWETTPRADLSGSTGVCQGQC